MAAVEPARRLLWLQERLTQAEGKARLWTYGWGGGIAAAGIGSLLAVPFVAPENRVDWYTGAVSAGVGVAALAIAPPVVLQTAPALRAEEWRARRRPRTSVRCCWSPSLTSFASRVTKRGKAGGTCTSGTCCSTSAWACFSGSATTDWEAGAINAAVGAAVGEALILHSTHRCHPRPRRVPGRRAVKQPPFDLLVARRLRSRRVDYGPHEHGSAQAPGRAVVPIAFAAFAAALAAAPRARACGVSTADGLSSCSLAEHEEETRPRWRLGASGSYTSTAIDFGAFRSPETRGSVIASLGLPADPALDVAARRGEHRRRPPGHARRAVRLLGGSDRGDWRLLARGPGTKPFVILTSNLSFSTAKTEPTAPRPPRTVATPPSTCDWACWSGRQSPRVLSPYAVGRVFGGPVYWAYQGEDVTGTDTHHYQLGAGLTVVAFGRVNVFAEGVPIGERSFAAGTAFAF